MDFWSLYQMFPVLSISQHFQFKLAKYLNEYGKESAKPFSFISDNIPEPVDVITELFAKQPLVGSQYLSGEQ